MAASPQLDQRTIDAFSETQKALFASPRWKEVRKRFHTVERFQSKFNRRKYARVHLPWMYDIADRLLVPQLGEAIPAFNEALRAYRAEHKVTPVPEYLLPVMENEGYKGAKVTSWTGDRMPLSQFQTIDPRWREEIVISKIDFDEEAGRHYCGFCGNFPPVSEPSEEGKRWSYSQPAFMGLGRRITVCGEELCSGIAIADNVRLDRAFGRIDQLVERSVLRGVAQSLGRETLTPTQLNFLTANDYDALRRKATRNIE